MLTRRFLALMLLLCLSGLALAQAQPDQPAKPMRIRISPGLADKNKIHDVSPHYPPEARVNRIQGEVLLQIVIDTQGKPTNIKVLQGDPTLAEASIDAVRQWRYRPYLIKGEPVEVETTVKIQFHM